MTNAEIISKTVAWYNAIPSNYPDVEKLIYARKGLSCTLFNFAAEVGELYQEKLAAEFRRKAKIDRLTNEYTTQGDSVAAAEKKAREAATDEAKDEMLADGIWKSAELLRTHGMAVLDTMNQHISSLKQERRLETSGQGSQGT